MNGEQLKQQLENILHGSFRLERVGVAEWKGPLTASVEQGGSLLFPIHQEGKQVLALATGSGWITESERRLIELTIEAGRAQEHKAIPETDKDQFATTLRAWIDDNGPETGFDEPEMPATLASYSSLFATKIPFLLHGEITSGGKNSQVAELKKMMETFFDGEVVIVALRDKEWLVLGHEELLANSDEDEDESTEERLSSLCIGLHSMLSTEGAGECHCSVYYPIIPAKSLPHATWKLREAIATGRLQRTGQFVHLPWELYLDQLLSPLSHADRLRFVEQVFKRVDPHLDAETVQTLETFFELDCNVSETAKKLFIHRNTLLYRLDKFKQESGLDVRTFNQAVLVMIALQLYKVTKRQ